MDLNYVQHTALNKYECISNNVLSVADNDGQYDNKIYFSLEQGYYCIIFTCLTVYGCLETVLDWQEITLS